MIGAALIGLSVLMLPIVVVTFSTFSLNFTDEWTMAIGLSVALLPSAALFLSGMWLLSRPTGPGRPDGDLTLRLLALWMVIAAAGPIIAYYVLRFSGSIATMSVVTGVLAALGGVVAIALFRRLAVLARRAPAPLLAGDMPWMGWIVASAFAVPLIVTLFHIFPPTIHRHWTVYPWLLAIVFVTTVWCWSIYLMVRAAIAFRQPLIQAREMWREGDFRQTAEPQA